MKSKCFMVFAVLVLAAGLSFGWVEPDPMVIGLAGVGMIDVFKSDAFGLIRLTDAINKRPFEPGRLGAMGLFRETGMDTLAAAIEEKNGILYLVPNRARGADATQNQKEGRKLRMLSAVHLPVQDRLMADEIQGVRSFGSSSQLETIQQKVNEKLDTVVSSLNATLEHLRVGAVKGIVVDADGATTLYNLFTEFGISQPDDEEFDFSSTGANSTGDRGFLRKQVAGLVRRIVNALGAAPISGIHAFCGDEFFDELVSSREVTMSYRGTPMAQVLREGFVYPNGMKVHGAFEFGGVVWENYRGSIGGTPFITTSVCHFVPVGVPDLFQTRFAPANYMQTVNTMGLPMYAKTTLDPKDRWVDIDAQSNPLCYCTRPSVLIRGTIGTT